MYTPLSITAVDAIQKFAIKANTCRLFDGRAYSFTFPNDFGMSIVKCEHSRGSEEDLFEVAVTTLNGDICFSTPITDNVIGWLTEDGVVDLAHKIAALDKEKILYEMSDDERRRFQL